MDGFAVLADGTRRRILDLLRQEPRDVGTIVASLGLSQPNASKHLRVLRDAGLVEVTAEGPRRVYRLTDAPLHEVEEWLRPYRERWTRGFDALDRRLAGHRARRSSGGPGDRPRATGTTAGTDTDTDATPGTGTDAPPGPDPPPTAPDGGTPRHQAPPSTPRKAP
ncbi:ArsR/SmtB family transcription factor [Streptomyces marincola]|uniref:ArsR/SmtB family transcription factor n=1 Tax=Streptomyces marincola TaxID=2878388 RepID=UPI00298FD67D|nr:metalloregulator ArsR/SmtB family transcription factor [Streptomyces marincola]